MANNDFLRYNSLDAACTLEAHNEFWRLLEQDGFQSTYDMTARLFEPLMFMQTRGIAVNHAAMEETKREIKEQAGRAQEELNALCGRELNVNSPKDCQQYFYIEKGLPPYHNKEGRITVDDLALQRMARGTAKRSGLREAKLVQEIRGLGKLHATYLDIEFDKDGRIRCSYNPRGTKFGRLSSSATVFGTGTNLQNLPQAFKKFLVADPGYVMWEVDKRQAEWVVVAYLANDASMIKVVEDELDAHTYTASMMFVVPEELVKYENKLIGNTTDSDLIERLRLEDPELVQFARQLPRTMSARQAGKKSNHGLNYDETFVMFALVNEMEQAEAKRIINLYHRIYPGIRQVFHENVKRSLQRDRTLTNCFGRKVRFLDAYGPDLWKAGYAMLPQSTVVDSPNMGMVECYHDDWLCQGPGGIDLLAQVHDSLLFQVPVEWFKNAGAFEGAVDRVYKALEPTLEYNGRKFTIKTDSKIGLNWGGYNKDTNPNGMREVKNSKEAIQLVEQLCLVKSQTGSRAI